MKTNIMIKSVAQAIQFSNAVAKLQHSEVVNGLIIRYADYCANRLAEINQIEKTQRFDDDDAFDALILIIERLAAFEGDCFDVVFDPCRYGLMSVSNMTVEQALDAARDYAVRMTINEVGVEIIEFAQAAGGDSLIDEIKL